MSLAESNIRPQIKEKLQVKTNDSKFPMVLGRDTKPTRPDSPEEKVDKTLRVFDVFGIIPKRKKRDFKRYE